METSLNIEDSSISEGRSLRKRQSKPPIISKRRKSEEKIIPEDISIEDVYRQDSAKIANFHPSSLETIYESPRGKTNCSKDFMGVVKLKRHVRFSPFHDPPKFKVKQRKNRAKSLKRIGVKSFGAKVTLEQVEKAINEISGDEDEENNSRVSNATLNSKNWCYEGNIIIPDNSFHAVNDLTSSLADMDMSQWESEEETYRKNNFSFEKKDFQEDPINDLCMFLPSPSKTKSKKDRRRSGRIPPRVLEESSLDIRPVSPKLEFLNSIVDESQTRHIINRPPMPVNLDAMETDVFNFQTELKNLFPEAKNNLSITNVVEASTVHISPLNTNTPTALTSVQVDETMNKTPHISKQTSKKHLNKTKKVSRRISGIRRPLYHSHFNVLNELEKSPVIDLQVSDKTNSFESLDHLNKASTSPTCLFGNLKISSPGLTNLTECKKLKTRRRSARLSLKGMQMGTIWTDTNSSTSVNSRSVTVCTSDSSIPQKNCLPTEYQPQFSKTSSPISGEHHSQDMFLNDNKSSSFSTILPEVASENSNNVVPNTFLGQSPIVSGIFDSRARISKGKKLILKKSRRSINLDSFKPSEF